MPEAAILQVIDSESNDTYRVKLPVGRHLVGSDPDCDVVVDSPYVAPQQLRLVVEEEQLTIEPVGESFDTLLVNGLTIRDQRRLPYPQSIELGPLTILVSSATDSTTVPISDSSPASSADRYLLGEEIARGGMGVIIEAEETSLERNVAMKRILQETVQGMPVSQERFLREAKVLGRLEHPNIVPIHDLGEDSDGNLFYTMKKVEGHTLQAVIDGLKRSNPDIIEEYPLDHLLSIFRKICDAISFAHSRGVVHRDLKPENIMIGEFGEVLVMDWGLAKLMDEEEIAVSPAYWLEKADAMLTLEGDVMGSPHFMPPEQAEGNASEIDERSDIFSLGAILYSILTLSPPVEGQTVQEVLANVLSGTITPPARIMTTNSRGKTQNPKGESPEPGKVYPVPHCPGGRIPPALSAVAMQALAMEKSARYQTVTDLVADIAAHQGGFSTSVESIGALGQLRLLILRNKGISITAAALMAIILALWITFTINLQAKEQAARLAEQKAVANLAEAKLTLADSSYRQRRFTEMSAHLEDCPEEFRDQEWDYLAAQADNSIAAVHADHGRFIAVAACRAMPGLFALADSEGGVTLLDARTGQKLKRFHAGIGEQVSGGMEFSPDGTTLALVDLSRLVLCDLPSGKIRETWNLDPGRRYRWSSVSFSADGRQVLLGVAGHQIELRAIPGGRVVEQFDGHPPIKNANFSPSGKKIFAEQYGGQTLLMDSLNAKPTVFPANGYGQSAGFTDREDRFVSMSEDGAVHLFRVADTKRLWTLETELMGGRVFLSAAPHETTIAFGHNVHGEGLGIAIGAATDSERRVVQKSFQGLPGVSVESAYSRETGLLVALDNSPLGEVSGARIWRVLPDRVRAQWAKGVRPLDFAFSVRDRVWLPAWGQLQFALPGSPPLEPEQEFPGSGESVIESSRDGARVALLDQRKLLFFRDHDGAFSRVAVDETALPKGKARGQMDFSGDGRLLLASLGFSCLIYDFDSARLLHRIDSRAVAGRISHLAFLGAEDDRFLTVHERKLARGRECRLTLWDFDGNRLKSIVSPHGIASLDAAPDGTAFALGCDDGRVRIRDAATLEVIDTFRAHDAAVTALEYHPVDAVLATGSEDLRIKLWDLESRQPVHEIIGPLTPITYLHFNPAGDKIGAGSRLSDISKNQVVRVWDLSPNSADPEPFDWDR